MPAALADILDAWGLSGAILVSETGHARVWKVRTQDGQMAALKLYNRQDRGNEAAGTRILRMWNGAGAVRILAEAEEAVLMEWLSGPTLGDVARDGKIMQALSLFAETAERLQSAPIPDHPAWRPLSHIFDPLFTCTFSSDCPVGLKTDMQMACDLAHHMLDNQTNPVPLHGDLHPDNVILTNTGPKVIDAKGYVGDRAFELANALRHPKGMSDLVRRPEQIERCLTLYADAMNVSRDRLAKWAAAKCALSIFWRAGGTIGHDPEADLLRLLLEAAGQ